MLHTHLVVHVVVAFLVHLAYSVVLPSTLDFVVAIIAPYSPAAPRFFANALLTSAAFLSGQLLFSGIFRLGLFYVPVKVHTVVALLLCAGGLILYASSYGSVTGGAAAVVGRLLVGGASGLAICVMPVIAASTAPSTFAQVSAWIHVAALAGVVVGPLLTASPSEWWTFIVQRTEVMLPATSTPPAAPIAVVGVGAAALIVVVLVGMWVPRDANGSRLFCTLRSRFATLDVATEATPQHSPFRGPATVSRGSRAAMRRSHRRGTFHAPRWEDPMDDAVEAPRVPLRCGTHSVAVRGSLPPSLPSGPPVAMVGGRAPFDDRDLVAFRRCHSLLGVARGCVVTALCVVEVILTALVLSAAQETVMRVGGDEGSIRGTPNPASYEVVSPNVRRVVVALTWAVYPILGAVGTLAGGVVSSAPLRHLPKACGVCAGCTEYIHAHSRALRSALPSSPPAYAPPLSHDAALESPSRLRIPRSSCSRTVVPSLALRLGPLALGVGVMAVVALLLTSRTNTRLACLDVYGTSCFPTTTSPLATPTVTLDPVSETPHLHFLLPLLCTWVLCGGFVVGFTSSFPTVSAVLIGVPQTEVVVTAGDLPYTPSYPSVYPAALPIGGGAVSPRGEEISLLRREGVSSRTSFSVPVGHGVVHSWRGWVTGSSSTALMSAAVSMGAGYLADSPELLSYTPRARPAEPGGVTITPSPTVVGPAVPIFLTAMLLCVIGLVIVLVGVLFVRHGR